MSSPLEFVSASSNSIHPCFHLLGVRVHAVQIPNVIDQIERWISGCSSGHFIAVTGMHGIMEARHESSFKEVLNSADLVVPDGTPLVWTGRWHGFTLPRRVYGPELMECFCRQTANKGYRHFFYGGGPEVASQLAASFAERFPGLQIAGHFCPPFRELTEDEDQTLINIIRQSNADLIWVGLSTPKQEKWMFQHVDKLNVSVLVGVGAAFDFHTGRSKQAPRWMREHGLEWLFRLCSEPRRLWRRYLVYGSEFIWLAVLELLGFRKFN